MSVNMFNLGYICINIGSEEVEGSSDPYQHQRGQCGGGGGVQVLRGVPGPQTELVQERGHCLQEGPESPLFSEATEVL